MYLGVLLLIILFFNTKLQTWACLVLRMVTASEHHVLLPCELGKLLRCKGRCGAHPNAHYYCHHHNHHQPRHYHHYHRHQRRRRHNHHPNVEVYL